MIRRPLLSLAFVFAATGIAAAAPEIPEDMRKALWCASAFEQVEPAVRPQDEKAADQFITYSQALRTQLAASFREQALSQADVDAIQEDVVKQVIGELGEGGSPAYPFEVCQALGLAAYQALPTAPAKAE